MTSVVQTIHRMRSSGLPWLIASAVLFLPAAASFDGAGSHALAALGVAGAIGAVAVIIAPIG
jgi:hypothetical protein